MNSSNLLSVISTFLDLETLLEFSVVNKTFLRVSKASDIWKFYFYSAYFGDLSIFG